MLVSDAPSRMRAGRPKDATKRAAILAAAESLFRSQPYETVTMEAVAARAGVSKMTLYSHFADKETIFETVVRAISDEMTSAVSGPDQAAAPLRDRLNSIGIAFLTVVLDASVRMIRHTLAASLHTDQALARRFYDAGPGRARQALSAIIEAAAARGELTTDSPEWAADDLISLWEGGLPGQLAFGLIEQTTADEIVRRARRGTETFLRAYARPANGWSRPANPIPS
jgi:TetR/AcrR family transcriptional repressor of mexJK operon